jgi:hypothetical protein
MNIPINFNSVPTPQAFQASIASMAELFINCQTPAQASDFLVLSNSISNAK